MNYRLKIEVEKRFKTIFIHLVMYGLLIVVAGCTSVVVQPQEQLQPQEQVYKDLTATPQPQEQLLLQEQTHKESEAVPQPVIASVSQSTAANGELTLMIKGSELDGGDVVEIYDSSGKYIGSGNLSVSPGSRTNGRIVMKGVKAGKYTVKIKKTNGQYSKAEPLMVPKPPAKKPVPMPKPKEQCSGSFSKEPNVVYLGGGVAANLLDGYLAQQGANKKNISYYLKIKFYTKEADNLNPVTVALDGGGGLEAGFVESPEDFINKIKKKFKGRVAELPPTFVEDALREKADYFQCPAK